MKKQEPINVTSASLALMTAALWGGVVVAVKYSEDTLSPIAVAAVRFALAAGFMLVWCLLRGCSLRMAGREARLALVVGLMLFVQILLFNFAIHWSNSSHGILLISSFVFWVALIEHFVTKADRLTPRKLQGIALAAAGVGLTLVKMNDHNELDIASAQADLPTIAGDVLMLLSALMLAIKFVFTKFAVSRVEPQKLMFWHHVIGTTLFTTFAVMVEGPPSTLEQSLTTPVILALLYQGLLVGGVCFAIQALLLRRHSATAISVFSFATPIFGVVAALTFRGDAYSTWLLMAGSCVAIGIYLVNTRARQNTETGKHLHG